MSQNRISIPSAGLDVAKAALQFRLRGVSHALENTPKDHARLLRPCWRRPRRPHSGPHKGVRFICGGRATVRCALYPSASLRAFGMAAMSAIRHDPILREFYQRLRAACKVKMVALTAVMRKLLLLLNRLLKKPGFTLRCAQ